MLVADVSLAEQDTLPPTHPAPPAEWGTHTHTCGPAAPPWSCAVAQALAPCMFQLCTASLTANSEDLQNKLPPPSKHPPEPSRGALMAQLKVTTEPAQEPRGHTVSKGGSKGSTGPASQPEQAD